MRRESHVRFWEGPGVQFPRATRLVDTAKSRAVYEEWKKLTKPAKGPLRRPLWMNRPLRPADEAYRLG